MALLAEEATLVCQPSSSPPDADVAWASCVEMLPPMAPLTKEIGVEIQVSCSSIQEDHPEGSETEMAEENPTAPVLVSDEGGSPVDDAACISASPFSYAELGEMLKRIPPGSDVVVPSAKIAEALKKSQEDNEALRIELDEAKSREESIDARLHEADGKMAQLREEVRQLRIEVEELEADYQKQVDEVYFFGYRCCMKKHGIKRDSAIRMDAVSLTSFAQSKFLPNSAFASSYCLASVRVVGSPISIGMTASIPYARAKGVFPVGRPGVFRTEIPESDAIKLWTVVDYNGLGDSKAVDDVLPYELGDIFALEIGTYKGSLVQVPLDQGETRDLHSDLVCLLGLFGQSSCSEVPYNVFRPLLAICLACLDGLACTCIGNNMASLMGREVAMPARITRHARILKFVFLLDVPYHEFQGEDCSKSPTPDPDDREAPSTRKVHHSFSLDSLRWIGLREYFSTKSAITWPFMDNLARPPGGLGSKGGASGRHFEEPRPALQLSVHPLAPAFRIAKKKGRSSSVKRAIKRPSATSLPVRHCNSFLNLPTLTPKAHLRWKTSCKWRTCSSRVLLLTMMSSIYTSTVRPIREHPLPSSRIHNLIYPWQRKTVFWACIIEVGVIDAHSPFAFLFGYHHYICQPVWILYFSDESGLQQLVNLIQDNLLPIRVKTSNILSDGSCCWQDVKLMGDDGRMNSHHIRMRPCEKVMAFSEGVLDVSGFFWRQEGTDVCKVYLPIFSKEAYHLMIRRGDDFHVVQSCAPQDNIEGLDRQYNISQEVVDAPLNPDKIRPGFSRPVRLRPMWLMTDACTRSAELPGSTRIRLMSNSPISRDRMRALRCGCNIRVGFTSGKMIVPSMGQGPALVIPGQMELMRSRTNASRNNLCLFRLESCSSSDGPPLI
ncbi:hypothetical protein AAG906_009092 [Vitis piasezkii]